MLGINLAGIHASRCLASCCTVDWYSWTLYGGEAPELGNGGVLKNW